jgi:hypothetical protein
VSETFASRLPRLTARVTKRSSAYRGMLPYSAKHMASMTVDLPAPVGPMSAK